MQYKQVRRIGLEILSSPDISVHILKAVARLLEGKSFPNLGPYRKRSPEQALWRIASNAQLGAAQRWAALRKLLRTGVTTTGDACASPGKGVGRTGGRRRELADRTEGRERD